METPFSVKSLPKVFFNLENSFIFKNGYKMDPWCLSYIYINIYIIELTYILLISFSHVLDSLFSSPLNIIFLPMKAELTFYISLYFFFSDPRTTSVNKNIP